MRCTSFQWVVTVDGDIAQGALLTSFRVHNEPLDFYTTLPDAYPHLADQYPLELVHQRIYHHQQSGIDLLFAGYGLRDQLDLDPERFAMVSASLAQLDYDIICYDLPGDWKGRSTVIALLTQANTSAIVICPPGRKERTGAQAALDVIGKIARSSGKNALESTMILFKEGERGSAMAIREVRSAIMRQYPMVTDLGILPHDTALISLVAEHPSFVPHLTWHHARPTAWRFVMPPNVGSMQSGCRKHGLLLMIHTCDHGVPCGCLGDPHASQTTIDSHSIKEAHMPRTTPHTFRRHGADRSDGEAPALRVHDQQRVAQLYIATLHERDRSRILQQI